MREEASRDWDCVAQGGESDLPLCFTAVDRASIGADELAHHDGSCRLSSAASCGPQRTQSSSSGPIGAGHLDRTSDGQRASWPGSRNWRPGASVMAAPATSCAHARVMAMTVARDPEGVTLAELVPRPDARHGSSPQVRPCTGQSPTCLRAAVARLCKSAHARITSAAPQKVAIKPRAACRKRDAAPRRPKRGAVLLLIDCLSCRRWMRRNADDSGRRSS